MARCLEFGYVLYKSNTCDIYPPIEHDVMLVLKNRPSNLFFTKIIYRLVQQNECNQLNKYCQH